MQEKEALDKKEVGDRFRYFREAVGKAQHEMAAELRVSQSTIANIERGKAYPNITYLFYYHRHNKLNLHWLLTGEGDIFSRKSPIDQKYEELLNLMRIPIIEEQIFARFVEIRAILKSEIKEYWETFEKNEKEINDETTDTFNPSDQTNTATEISPDTETSIPEDLMPS